MCAVQDTHLFSADATIFLKPQSDGNLVLYNTERYSTYGDNSAAAVWASNTYLASTAPYNLVMQPVSHCCCTRARHAHATTCHASREGSHSCGSVLSK
jgi:hypothetical protein